MIIQTEADMNTGRILQLTIHMLVIGFGLLLATRGGLDGYRYYRISVYGQTTNARVIEKHEDHSGRYTQYLVAFTFTPKFTNRSINKTANVYFDTYQALQPESLLSVHYLSAQPTETLVDGQAPFPLWGGLLGMLIIIVGIIDLRKALRNGN